MVISVNPEPDRKEFEVLLCNTVNTLKLESTANPVKYCSLLGNKLEKEVKDILSMNAIGTAFEDSIELISGQRFPDIVAKKYYGVEVKTTKANHWKSTGSSVAEGTRVEGVERIFMLFGKMCDPVDFICRPYEECLSEVVVTHSPRYLIDMNIQKGQTIFDKIDMPYDILRREPDPIRTVLNYYKKKLKPGESTWWSGDESLGNNIIIRVWNQLDAKERNFYKIKGFCLFPELLGVSLDKYNRFGVWLASREGIVCPNVRDAYSAGGRRMIDYKQKSYCVPQIIAYLDRLLPEIKELLFKIDIDELKEFWNVEVSTRNIYEKWCELVSEEAKKTNSNGFPLKEYLMEKGNGYMG